MKPVLERARALEKAGKLAAAVLAYRDAGAVDDAARVLGALRKPADAAQLLMASVGVQPAQVGQLEPALKKRALMAAIFFGRAGNNESAVQLFLALGERSRAVDLLQRAGDQVGAAKLASGKGAPTTAVSLVPSTRPTAVGGKASSIEQALRLEQAGKLELAMETYVQLRKFSEAARLATALGRTADAAQLHADAGQPFQAAQRYLEAGDTGKALDNLIRVPRDDANYRAAAIEAVRLSSALNVLSFQMEHFLGSFLKPGPQGPAERETFYQLARLYLAHDFPDNAREALTLLVAQEPGFKDAAARLASLEEEAMPSLAVARQVLADADLAGRKKAPQKSLTPLPLSLEELPDLPADPTVLYAGAGLPAGAGPRAGGDETLPEADVLPLDPKTSFEPGGTIAGRYQLEERIGRGGMAQVFRARDLELEEDVALKVFALPTSSELHVQRFKQELKLSRQLIHPNIIRLYDIGLHEGYRYISMELLVGETLKARMEQPIDFDVALGFLIQACEGLQAAHDVGVIHRDVKPDNFFVSKSGVLKVMDFGIAKQFTSAPGLTVAGSIAGTPLYMSPEQISNFSAVSASTDLYALGVVAYEMFAGSVPFNHEEMVPLLMMHVNDRPQAPRVRNPGIPVDLELAILKLLEKDPARRFASCRELGKVFSVIRARYIG